MSHHVITAVQAKNFIQRRRRRGRLHRSHHIRRGNRLRTHILRRMRHNWRFVEGSRPMLWAEGRESSWPIGRSWERPPCWTQIIHEPIVLLPCLDQPLLVPLHLIRPLIIDRFACPLTWSCSSPCLDPPPCVHDDPNPLVIAPPVSNAWTL